MKISGFELTVMVIEPLNNEPTMLMWNKIQAVEHVVTVSSASVWGGILAFWTIWASRMPPKRTPRNYGTCDRLVCANF